jgi:glycosyltransferase involved in cell wall biosynthesis
LGRVKKIAFVIPWYFDAIGGGAESACRSLSKTLQRHGVDVEILTTCLRDFRSDWSKNYFPEGPAREGGIPVRRFPVTRRNQRRFDEVNAVLMRGLPVPPDDERTFLSEMVNSPKLIQFIERNRSEYTFLFLPYLFSTTYWGALAAGDSGVLIPCLHDEAYSRLGCFADMFAEAGGAIFLSGAERDLARRLYPSFRELGVFGVPLDCSWRAEPSRFVARFGLRDFLVYAGRIDPGKNADLLLSYFGRYLEESGEDLQLVFIGAEKVPHPEELAKNIHVLGFLSEQDKRDCFGAALALCIPSVMESFSIVMMESWLAGRPVIVNEQCPVTTGFCRESNGGLWFSSYSEFREIVHYLRRRPKMAEAMGAAGSNFVRARFDPPIVARNYLSVLSHEHAIL